MQAERPAEVAAKLSDLRAAMDAAQVEVVTLNQIPDVAWLSAGATTHVNSGTEQSVVTLVVTSDQAYAVTDTIEAPRMAAEEALEELGFEVIVEPWYARGPAIDRLLAGRQTWRPADGGPLGEALLRLRTTLRPGEIDRLRQVSHEAAAAVEEATLVIRPGMKEYAIAAMLDLASRARGGQAIVNLVATDERISQFRHPLPSAKVLERYAMLVLCYRRYGFVVSATRLIHFGPLPDELQRRADATAAVDARILLASQPGQTLGGGFAVLKEAYADVGFPEAIEEHHQGGLAGYRSRERIATPNDPTPIAAQQMFAWNPSIRGVKSEDSVLTTDLGIPEVLTTTGNWPTATITVGDHSIARPLIYVK